jgi:nucleoside phosphorylase
MAALPLEVRPFLRQVKAKACRDMPLPLWEFPVGEGRGVLALSGMGPGRARLAADRLLAQYRPTLLLCLGFGGALTPGLASGALVLGESFWQFEPESGALLPVAAPAPPRPLPELLDHLRAAGLTACLGSLVSTPYIIHKQRQGGPLRHLPGPVLDLETSAAAGAAAARGLAFLGLRAITDAAGEEIPEFLARAAGREPAPGPPAALAWLAKDPRRLSTLLTLRQRARHAAQHLARALNVLLPLL